MTILTSVCTHTHTMYKVVSTLRTGADIQIRDMSVSPIRVQKWWTNTKRYALLSPTTGSFCLTAPQLRLQPGFKKEEKKVASSSLGHIDSHHK